ncbi:MAG: hypothetical protein WCG34_00335, partial [Leptolinea sp.]
MKQKAKRTTPDAIRMYQYCAQKLIKAASLMRVNPRIVIWLYINIPKMIRMKAMETKYHLMIRYRGYPAAGCGNAAPLDRPLT